MALLADLFGGSLLEGVKGIIGEFKLDPAKKAEMIAAADANATQLALKQTDLQEKLEAGIADETKAAIAAYQAEQTGDDTYTKRWRPTFGYMVTLLLFWNYAIVPLFGRTPVVIPKELFEMFGALLLVAIGGRSFEKIFAGKN